MAYVIAISGKGGVGKTTITSLIIKYLLSLKKGSILAVDADPSFNLHFLLGMDAPKTLGQLRESAKKDKPNSMDLFSFLEYGINMAISEGKIDLLAMGRKEGKGCYCSVNNALREKLKTVTKSYDYIVIDNEAGIEHISRQTDAFVDIMFIVIDPSKRSLITAQTIISLIKELENDVGKVYLIGNKMNEIPNWVKTDIPFLGAIPLDPMLQKYEDENLSFLSLPETSIAYQELSKCFRQNWETSIISNYSPCKESRSIEKN
ncbi:MAG: AAA family ATPase [bacterium]